MFSLGDRQICQKLATLTSFPKETIRDIERDDMKEIKLTRGMVALVDNEDFDWLNQWKWQADKGRRTYYAVRSVWKNGRTAEKYYMHREIMKVPPDMQVDHISGNGLDCQKHNMRVCTVGQNNMNRSKHTRKCHSRFVGVSLDKRRGTWQAYINIGGKRTYLGTFADEVQAAIARNLASYKLFGEFARLNIIA